ncbi:MAG: amidohydrolase [Caldisericia bacterium]|nr:amidohydrolase [Caldisericia bacterium]
MLIKNTTIINFSDLKIEKNKDILIEGNIIKKIGENLEGGQEVINGENFYTMPGLINCHSHVAMTLIRGSAEDVNSTDWFNKYIWIYEKNLKPHFVYFGTLLGAAEMLLSGVTTVFDHYFYMDEAYKAYDESGMRADLAWALFGIGEGEEENFKKAMDFIEKYNGLSDRLTLSLGPHSPYVCPEDFLKKFSILSQTYKLKIHIHASEMEWQVEKSLKEKGRTPIEYLYNLDLIKENTLIAHAYRAKDEDLKIIKNEGAFIAHAAKTFMKFGDLSDILVRILKEGVRCGFATDGVVSNNTLSIFESGRFAALNAKISKNNAEIAKIEELIPLFSSGGSLLSHINLGEIKEGYVADLILVNKNSPSLNPFINIFANLLYSISERDIDTVIVNGKVVVKNGKILTIDIPYIMKEINKIKDVMLIRSEIPMQKFGV